MGGNALNYLDPIKFCTDTSKQSAEFLTFNTYTEVRLRPCKMVLKS